MLDRKLIDEMIKGARARWCLTQFHELLAITYPLPLPRGREWRKWVQGLSHNALIASAVLGFDLEHLERILKGCNPAYMLQWNNCPDRQVLDRLGSTTANEAAILLARFRADLVASGTERGEEYFIEQVRRSREGGLIEMLMSGFSGLVFAQKVANGNAGFYKIRLGQQRI